MRNDADPLQASTQRLTEALTAASARVRSADGLLTIDAHADGELRFHIADAALAFGGDELARQLTDLAARSLAAARSQAAAALAEFRADPRIEAAVSTTVSAIDQPRPDSAPADLPGRSR